MEILANPIVICALIAVVFGLFAYAIFVPKNSGNFELSIDPDNKEARMLGLVSRIGDGLYSALPAGVSVKTKSNPRLESLIRRSGNPWGLTAEEFSFFRVVTAFMGLCLGFAAWFFLTFVKIHTPLWLFALGAAVLGFFLPQMKYKEQAKKRDLEFKRQLPEALDLIIISLSGGATFVQALRESLPNMQDGILKEEFVNILKSIDAGRTLDESLLHFSDRSPNDSIKTFITAVREANELNVPLVDTLQSRAEASRQEFFALIQSKTAVLPTKMMVVLTPTLIPALMIIVLTPAIGSLISSLG